MERHKSSRELKQAYKEIREAISAKVAPFDKNAEMQKEQRKQKALVDLQFFGETYFPHYLTAPPSTMHKEMYMNFQNEILAAESAKMGRGSASRCILAAPRGNAKSTLVSLLLPLWCIVGRRRRFIGILSDTTEQANEFLEFIKAELETNERLRTDFPDICGPGRTWKTGHIITMNGTKVRRWVMFLFLRLSWKS